MFLKILLNIQTSVTYNLNEFAVINENSIIYILK